MCRFHLQGRIRIRGQGMSLIEVLISLVILSVGVLAVAALQLISKRNNMDAGQRTIAAQLAYDIIERMRANSSIAALGAYIGNASPYPTAYVGRQALGTEPTPGCKASDNNASPVSCNATQLALHDLWLWEQALDGAAESVGTTGRVGGLTFPTACIEGPAGGGSGPYTVTIVWRGNVPIPDRTDVPCGDEAEEGGTRLYGDSDEFRRAVVIQAYITARASST